MQCSKFILIAMLVAAMPLFAQDQTNIQDLEILKQTLDWQEIKKSYSDSESFFNAARTGFSLYFKKYGPKVFLEDENTLVMTAKYGKHDVMCTFFIDAKSKYIVTIETKFDRDRQKWLKNVVKEVEKLGK